MKKNAITSMICITVIVITALLLNMNGLLLAVGIASIAGLGGYFTGKANQK